ncbi:MAG: hypothetical protein JOZ98_04415 [Solirubrobacterales bacterium]|nr:hypothetical protein [Solirubrobacterales bacterium]
MATNTVDPPSHHSRPQAARRLAAIAAVTAAVLVTAGPASAYITGPVHDPAQFGLAVDGNRAEGAKVLTFLARPAGADVDLVVKVVPGVTTLGQLANFIRLPQLVGLVPIGHLPHGASVTPWNVAVNHAPLGPGVYLVHETVVTPAGVPTGLPTPDPIGLEVDPDGTVRASTALTQGRVAAIPSEGASLTLGPDGHIRSFIPATGGASTRWWQLALAALTGLTAGGLGAAIVVRYRRNTARGGPRANAQA